MSLTSLLFLTSGVTALNTQVSTNGQNPTFRSAVELVIVRVNVEGRDHRPVAGLTKDDFVVLENGAPRQVTHFLSSEGPLDVALLLDTSSSMRPMLPLLRASASTLLHSLRTGDRGMVAAFNDRTETGCTSP